MQIEEQSWIHFSKPRDEKVCVCDMRTRMVQLSLFTIAVWLVALKLVV